MIITVIYTTLAAVKLKPEKNSGLNGIQTHGLCNTSAFFQALISQLLKVVYIAVMIIYLFIFSAVQIYDLSYIHLRSIYCLLSKVMKGSLKVDKC